MSNPRATDDGNGQITVSINDYRLESWSYKGDDERQQKMALARSYIAGWCDATGRYRTGGEDMGR